MKKMFFSRVFPGLAAICVVATIFLSCQKEKYKEEKEYLGWVANPANGLHQQANADRVVVDVQYKPLDYQVLLEAHGIKMSGEKQESRKQQLKGMQYYTLKFLPGEKVNDVLAYLGDRNGGLLPVTDRLGYEFQQSIRIYQHGDTLPCQLYHFENMYGISPYVSFSLGFEEQDSTGKYGDRMLEIDGRSLGLGVIEFPIKGSDIEQTPHLITN
ncbi:MAG: hypothetical protein FD123_632 [Bacteroidetes bacterium]|nr:MAG: hypothetical protein FD123_632 [Bacteroidota bacterium]